MFCAISIAFAPKIFSSFSSNVPSSCLWCVLCGNSFQKFLGLSLDDVLNALSIVFSISSWLVV